MPNFCEQIKKWPIHRRGIRRCYRLPMNWAQSSSCRKIVIDSKNSTVNFVNECDGNNTTSKHTPTILQVGLFSFYSFVFLMNCFRTNKFLLIKMLLRIFYLHTHSQILTLLRILHSHYVTIIYFYAKCLTFTILCLPWELFSFSYIIELKKERENVFLCGSE